MCGQLGTGARGGAEGLHRRPGVLSLTEEQHGIEGKTESDEAEQHLERPQHQTCGSVASGGLLVEWSSAL